MAARPPPAARSDPDPRTHRRVPFYPLGCGSGPLTLRIRPPIGGVLHWLRPGTVRLPPWPSRVPFTRGTARTAVDLVLYAAVLASAVWIVIAPGGGPVAAAPVPSEVEVIDVATEELHLALYAVR